MSLTGPFTEPLHTVYSTWKALNRAVSDWSRQIINGKLNCIGEVTLDESADSTDVVDQNIGINSVVSLNPLTANASAEIGNGTIYVDPDNYNIDRNAPQNNTFTITHANNAQTDRTFRYTIIG